MSSPTKGMWECRHGVDGRDWCEECHAPAPVSSPAPKPGSTAEDALNQVMASMEPESWEYQLLATVRGEIERLRVKCVFPRCLATSPGGERPPWCGTCVDAVRAESAEAEVRQLREERDEAIHALDGPDRFGRMWKRAESAEAEGRRLREERDAVMDAVGLPREASLDDLIRHHRGNAAMAAGFDQIAAAEGLRDARSFASSIQRNEGQWENQAGGLISRIDALLSATREEGADAR